VYAALRIRVFDKLREYVDVKYCLAVLIVLTLLISLGHAQDTVHVKAGWNIIGSVKSGAVPDVLSTIPDSIITGSFFGYAPGVGYQSKDTLDKGLGYWVKVKVDGIIIFDTAPAVDSCKSKALIYGGKMYNTVKLGDQCWMAENLDVGTMVPGITGQTDNATVEKYCYNDSLAYCTLYGGLYQWNEAMQYSATTGAQGICPTGWHIPTLAEYQAFSSVVGADGNALKAVSQGEPPEGDGTNTSGFSALLEGYRHYNGYFSSLGFVAYFWSSTESDAPGPDVVFLGYYGGHIALAGFDVNYGFGVRCVAD
jgi:uncharacterized protein (TIGR02145 family)